MTLNRMLPDPYNIVNNFDLILMKLALCIHLSYRKILLLTSSNPWTFSKCQMSVCIGCTPVLIGRVKDGCIMVYPESSEVVMYLFVWVEALHPSHQFFTIFNCARQ